MKIASRVCVIVLGTIFLIYAGGYIWFRVYRSTNDFGIVKPVKKIRFSSALDGKPTLLGTIYRPAMWVDGNLTGKSVSEREKYFWQRSTPASIFRQAQPSTGPVPDFPPESEPVPIKQNYLDEKQPLNIDEGRFWEAEQVDADQPTAAEDLKSE